jgi:hypothetical protein
MGNQRELKRPDVRFLDGANEVLGNLSKLDVEMLRGLTQGMEALISRARLVLDEDPLGLADQLSSDQAV